MVTVMNTENDEPVINVTPKPISDYTANHYSYYLESVEKDKQ